MSADEMVEVFKDTLLDEEIAELVDPESPFKTIYFAGNIPNRTAKDIDDLRKKNKELFITFNRKKAEMGDESQGNGEF
jgi:hypothetical protein